MLFQSDFTYSHAEHTSPREAAPITGADGGLKGGGAQGQQRFLQKSVSQCVVFGGGTRLTVLGK